MAFVDVPPPSFLPPDPLVDAAAPHTVEPLIPLTMPKLRAIRQSLQLGDCITAKWKFDDVDEVFVHKGRVIATEPECMISYEQLGNLPFPPKDSDVRGVQKVLQQHGELVTCLLHVVHPGNGGVLMTWTSPAKVAKAPTFTIGSSLFHSC